MREDSYYNRRVPQQPLTHPGPPRSQPPLNYNQPSNEQAPQIGRQLGDLIGAINNILMLLQRQYTSFPPPNYPYQRQIC